MGNGTGICYGKRYDFEKLEEQENEKKQKEQQEVYQEKLMKTLEKKMEEINQIQMLLKLEKDGKAKLQDQTQRLIQENEKMKQNLLRLNKETEMLSAIIKQQQSLEEHYSDEDEVYAIDIQQSPIVNQQSEAPIIQQEQIFGEVQTNLRSNSQKQTNRYSEQQQIYNQDQNVSKMEQRKMKEIQEIDRDFDLEQNSGNFQNDQLRIKQDSNRGFNQQQVQIKKKNVSKFQNQPLMDSVILTDQELQKRIIRLIESAKRLEILYRGSRDGFKSEPFRLQCGDQGATLTLYYSEECQRIFGGFTDIPWSKEAQDTQGMVYKHNSFLFRFNDDGSFLKIPNKKDVPYETQHGDGLMPCFWDDLQVYEDCDENSNNTSNLGCCYETPPGIMYRTNESFEFLAGESYFSIQEIEVFKVIY